jgi:hypothetical protein
MTLRFDVWLKKQQSRQDEIGELARVPSMTQPESTPSKRIVDEHHTWVDIVIGIGDVEHVPVFNDAWQEFLLAKQAAQGASD